MAFSDHLLKLEHWHLIHTDRFKLCYLPIAAVLSRNEMWSPFPTVFLRYSIVIIYYDTSVFIIKSWPPGLCPQDCIYIYISTYTAISHMRWCFSFTSPVSVWGRGGGSSGGGAGQHPSGAGLLAERGAAVAGPFARRIIRQRGQERREQLLIVPSGLLPVQRATEHARTHTYAQTRTYTHTHRDRKEVRLFVYLCRGTECYVFTLFCVVSVLYVS